MTVLPYVEIHKISFSVLITDIKASFLRGIKGYTDMLLIGLIAGAISGGLVEFLLNSLLPEKPKQRHVPAILVAILVFAGVAILSSSAGNPQLVPDAEQDITEIVLTMQVRESELMKLMATIQSTSREDQPSYYPTVTALAQQVEMLESTRVSVIRRVLLDTYHGRPFINIGDYSYFELQNKGFGFEELRTPL